MVDQEVAERQTMFAITLCKLAWYDKNFVVEVYMTPIEPSRFTEPFLAWRRALAAKVIKQHSLCAAL